MKRTKILGLVAVIGLLPALAGEEKGARAEYVGGTVSSIPSKAEGRITVAQDDYMLFQGKLVDVRVPFDRINTLEYGQQVGRRYVSAVLISPLFLLSKSRKHFLTIGYQDEEGRQQALVFRVSKNDVRPILVGLEAKTGRRIEYQDEEARKAGRG